MSNIYKFVPREAKDLGRFVSREKQVYQGRDISNPQDRRELTELHTGFIRDA